MMKETKMKDTSSERKKYNPKISCSFHHERFFFFERTQFVGEQKQFAAAFSRPHAPNFTRLSSLNTKLFLGLVASLLLTAVGRLLRLLLLWRITWVSWRLLRIGGVTGGTGVLLRMLLLTGGLLHITYKTKFGYTTRVI